jgi:hydroxymethylpyrimidine/phosphomethylpyrimidine kinase
MIPTALTIAGSDSSAGAGIQADLKTFAAHGVYGVCAITAVTAQNTTGVRDIHEIPPAVLAAQIDAVVDDFEVHAVKIGMLAGPAVVQAIVACLARYQFPQVVLDPVMLASSRQPLLAPAALDVIRSTLLGRVDVVTPNAAEAAALADLPVSTLAEARRAAQRIRAMGPRTVIITGGHLDEREAVDVVLDDSGCDELRGPRIETRSTHGTGCTFAAAIAANLACGRPARASAELAKQYVTGALQHGLALGRGPGPLDHFWAVNR